MKLFAMEALHFLHDLREKCLQNGGTYKGLTLGDIHTLEKEVLEQIPRISTDFPDLKRQFSDYLEFFTRICEKAHWSSPARESLIEIYKAEHGSWGESVKPLSDEKDGFPSSSKTTQSHETLKASTPVIPEEPSLSSSQENSLERKARIRELVRARLGSSKKEAVAHKGEVERFGGIENQSASQEPEELFFQREEESNIPFQEPPEPAPPSFLETAWEYFREELTINWFLFLGAFMVFSAGLFYTLVWWDEFRPFQQYLVSIASLVFAAGMERLLSAGMGLQKSPRIFAGMYILFLPMVLFLHGKLSYGLLFLTLAMSIPINLMLSRRYLDSPRSGGWGSLLLLLIPAGLFVDVFHSNFIPFLFFLAAAIIYLLLNSRTPLGSSGLLRFANSWIFVVAHFPFLEPIIIFWVIYVLFVRMAGSTAEGNNSSGFLYGSYLLIFLLSFFFQAHEFLYVASLLFTYRLHQWNEVDIHPIRSRFTLIFTSLIILLFPLVLKEFQVEISPFQFLAFEAISASYLYVMHKRYRVPGLGLSLTFFYLPLVLIHYKSDIRLLLHALIHSLPVLVDQIRFRRYELESYTIFLASLVLSFGVYPQLGMLSHRSLVISLAFLVFGFIKRKDFRSFNSLYRVCEVWLFFGFLYWFSHNKPALSQVYLEGLDLTLWLGMFSHSGFSLAGGVIALALGLSLLLLDDLRKVFPLVFVIFQGFALACCQLIGGEQSYLILLFIQIPFLAIFSPLSLKFLELRGFERQWKYKEVLIFCYTFVHFLFLFSLAGLKLSALYLLPSLVLLFFYLEGTSFFINFCVLIYTFFGLHLGSEFGSFYLNIHVTSLALFLFFLALPKLPAPFFLKERTQEFAVVNLLFATVLFLAAEKLSPLQILGLLILTGSFWGVAARFYKVGFYLYPLLILFLAIHLRSMDLQFLELAFYGTELLVAALLYYVSVQVRALPGRSVSFHVASGLNFLGFFFLYGQANFQLCSFYLLLPLLTYHFLRSSRICFQYFVIMGVLLIFHFPDYPISIGLLILLGALRMIRFKGFRLYWNYAPLIMLSHALGAIFYFRSLQPGHFPCLSSFICLGLVMLFQTYFLQRRVFCYLGMFSFLVTLFFLKEYGYVAGSGLASYSLLVSAALLQFLSGRLKNRFDVFEVPFVHFSYGLPLLVIFYSYGVLLESPHQTQYQLPLLIGLFYMGANLLMQTYTQQRENLCYLSFAFFGFFALALKVFGYIGNSGLSSYVMLALAILFQVLTAYLTGTYRIYKKPFSQAAFLLPSLVLVKEWFSIGNPLVVLITGLIFEWRYREDQLSYGKIIALISYNFAMYLFTSGGDFVLEAMSICSGFSVLWFAHSEEEKLSKESLQTLKVIGNFLFYSGALFDFVRSASIQALLFVWALTFLGGWGALLLKARIQFFASLLIFCASLVFFVIRQLFLQLSVGVPLILCIGLILIFIGVMYEKNKDWLSSIIQRFKENFSHWRD